MATAVHEETSCPVLVSWAGFVSCSWENEGRDSWPIAAGQAGTDPAGPVSLCPSHGSPCLAVQALGPGSLGWGLPEGAEGRRVQGAGLDLHVTPHTAHQTVPYFGNPSTSSWLKCVLEHTRSSPVQQFPCCGQSVRCAQPALGCNGGNSWTQNCGSDALWPHGLAGCLELWERTRCRRPGPCSECVHAPCREALPGLPIHAAQQWGNCP